MREILSDLDRWLEAGEQLAIARVVDLDGSGPRLPGAAMAVTASAEVAGSVSGGCVEGAVVTEALDVIATGQRRLVTFGYSDDEAFAVGLTCGGTIHLFVEPFDWGAVYPVLRDHIATETPVALANVIEGIGTGARMLISADTTQLAAPRSASSDVVAEACGTVADADAGAATDTASTSGADADVATQSTRASGVIGSLATPASTGPSSATSAAS